MSKKRPRSNNEKQKERTKKQRKWEQQDKTIKDFRAKSPYIKMILRGRGCSLPFYDYIDSYIDEFNLVATAAKAEHPSLIGILEVDDDTFVEPEKKWSELGCGELQQVFFNIGEDVPDYGAKSLDANMCGSTTVFTASDETVRTIILIRQSVKELPHRELKYALKLASLLHEIGHVQDLEQGINFNVSTRQFRVIEAEVFANLFALEKMAKHNLFQSFNLLIGGLRDAIPRGGYVSEVAQTVVERLPTYQLIEWQSFLEQPPNFEELQKLWPKGRELMAN